MGPGSPAPATHTGDVGILSWLVQGMGKQRSRFGAAQGCCAPSWLVLVTEPGVPATRMLPVPAGPVPSCPGLSSADPASAAQDFNKKHIMVSNALSGLHYGPGASLAPVVPYHFISDEPYLLSKRFHLNSINLSEPPWPGAAQRFPASPAWCRGCRHRGPLWSCCWGGIRGGSVGFHGQAPLCIHHDGSSSPLILLAEDPFTLL